MSCGPWCARVQRHTWAHGHPCRSCRMPHAAQQPLFLCASVCRVRVCRVCRGVRPFCFAATALRHDPCIAAISSAFPPLLWQLAVDQSKFSLFTSSPRSLPSVYRASTAFAYSVALHTSMPYHRATPDKPLCLALRLRELDGLAIRPRAPASPGSGDREVNLPAIFSNCSESSASSGCTS